MDLWVVVLSSTVVSGVISAIISGWVSLRSKKSEYAHQYYKLVLERRIGAYEEVERLIAAIKVAVVDKDQRPYHFLFSKEGGHSDVYKMLHGTMANSLWLTDDLFELTRKLNMLVFSETRGESSLVEFGKTNYIAIGQLRTQLERLLFRDMLTLHDVRAFLKSKNPTNSYAELPPSA
jgi:hypothetical protein